MGTVVTGNNVVVSGLVLALHQHLPPPRLVPTCCGGEEAHISDTVTLRADGGGGGGSIGVNGTTCLETKLASSARASLRALEMGSVTSSLQGEAVTILMRV